MACIFASCALANDPPLPPRLEKFDRRFKPGEIDRRCGIFLTNSRITQRSAGRRGHPGFHPSDFKPASLFQRIQRLAKFRLEIEGRKLADEWIAYDLARPVNHPTIPMKKIARNRHLYKRLNLMFHRRYTQGDTRTFLSHLRKNDPELWEAANAEMSKNDEQRAARAAAFNLEKVIRDWQQMKNADPNTFWPSYHHGGRAVALALGQVMQGDLSEEMTGDFLIALHKADETLYLTFALRLLEETRGDAVETTDNDRWLKAIDKNYVTWDMDRFLPPYETHLQLRESLEFYLGNPSSSRAAGFAAAVKKSSPLAEAWTKQVLPEREQEDEVTVITPPTSKLLTPQQTAKRWATFILGEAFRKPLVAYGTDQPLHLFLRRILEYGDSEAPLKTFLAEVKARNPFVHAYLVTAREVLDLCSQYADESGSPGMLRAASTAYRWIDYTQNRPPDATLMPPQRTHERLYQALFLMRTGNVQPLHFEVFRKVIEENSAILGVEVASWRTTSSEIVPLSRDGSRGIPSNAPSPQTPREIRR